MQSLKIAGDSNLPTVGLGLWKVPKKQTADVVHTAAGVRYRHFDSACDYGNESEAGHGFRRVMEDRICTREELWVTSKLWNTYHRKEHVRPACERTLNDLGLEYLDLYLMHFPISLRFVPFEDRYPPEWVFDPQAAAPKMKIDPVPIAETWAAMEELVDAGLVRHIGICNFGTSLLRDLLASSRIRPAVLQIESHPYLAQDKLIRFCGEEDIAVTAFSPLGALSYYSLGMAEPADSVLETEVVREIASNHQRTAAQVVLRWGVQRGTSIVPKTTRRERMEENLALFDFDLGEDEMTAISALDQHRRFNDPGAFCEPAFGTFCPIYE